MRNRERAQKINVVCTLAIVVLLISLMCTNPNKETLINEIIENSEFGEDKTQVIPEGTSEFVTIEFLRDELSKGIDRNNFILLSTYKVNESLSKSIPELYKSMKERRIIGVMNRFIEK